MISNKERLLYNLNEIKTRGYPVNNELILLFNNDNIIYDGQHRAGCLYYLYGNRKVPVRRLFFKNSKYSVDEEGLVLSRRIEVVCHDGEICYGRQQSNESEYLLPQNTDMIIIHNISESDEIIIDLSEYKSETACEELAIEINE